MVMSNNNNDSFIGIQQKQYADLTTIIKYMNKNNSCQ